MFRQVYNSVNDDIKGDRVILEKAFERAEQSEKKVVPLFKYSFVGTAVAAVLVIGAIMVHPDVFINKTDEIEEYRKEAVNTPVENAVENEKDKEEKQNENCLVAPISEDEGESVQTDNNAITENGEIENAPEQEVHEKETQKATEVKQEKFKMAPKPSAGQSDTQKNSPTGDSNDSIMVISNDTDELIAVYSLEDETEAATEATTFSLKGRDGNGEDTTQEDAVAAGGSSDAYAIDKRVAGYTFVPEEEFYQMLGIDLRKLRYPEGVMGYVENTIVEINGEKMFALEIDSEGNIIEDYIRGVVSAHDESYTKWISAVIVPFNEANDDKEYIDISENSIEAYIESDDTMAEIITFGLTQMEAEMFAVQFE